MERDSGEKEYSGRGASGLCEQRWERGLAVALTETPTKCETVSYTTEMNEVDTLCYSTEIQYSIEAAEKKAIGSLITCTSAESESLAAEALLENDDCLW